MLSIDATKSSPQIVFDPQTQTLSVIGESYPENSFEFFAPVFEWLRTELPGADELTLLVHIRYMNSSSTKCVLDILDILVDRVAEGAAMRVRWYYDAGNERAQDLAEEFMEDLDIPFEIVEFQPGGTYR
jgi:hypothetical protein